MSVDTRSVRSQRHETLAALIRRDAREIIAHWAERAIAEQEDCQRVHHAELIDHLPEFLEDLSRSLGESRSEDSRERWAREHGTHRWQTGWSLPEVVRDYQILRIVLLNHLEETLSRPLTSREILAIGVALDDAISTSVEAFVTETTQRQQMNADALREQTARLRELDRRKNEFLAVLGHELRNPLGPIKTALDLIDLSAGNPETINWSREVMHRQVGQMMRLVDDLLDFSRLSQGKLTLRRAKVDFATVVREALTDLQPAIQKAGLHLQSYLPTVPVWIEADAVRLRQIVTNLLVNAQKFTPPGGRISIYLETEDANQVSALRIRDTGIGIEPDLLPRLFETFTQGRASLDDGRTGLGLGLSLVKQLLEHHDGHVTASSAGVGRGAEFTVRIPCCET